MLEEGVENDMPAPKRQPAGFRKKIIVEVTRCSICDDEVPADILQAHWSLPKSKRSKNLHCCSRCGYVAHLKCWPADSEFQCPDCVDKDELDVDKILAWRLPVKDSSHEAKKKAPVVGSRLATKAVAQEWELLVKFQGRSYRDVRWVSSKWVDGVVREKLT
jgi:hypothetical protein